MITLTVIYPYREGAAFDFGYYEKTHLPLVAELWANAGLVEVRALRGLPGPDGSEAPFIAIALISFSSMDTLQAATSGPHIATIRDDIPNFTNVQPIRQINEVIGPL